MSKKQLQILVGLLLFVIIALLFMPTEKETERTAQTQSSVASSDTAAKKEQSQEIIQEKDDAEPIQEVQEKAEVVLEGVFLSLGEDVNRFDKKYMFMLLDDGTEILRIDLRPLLGYSDIEVISKLGVARGDRVVVTGFMETGEFKVMSIERQ